MKKHLLVVALCLAAQMTWASSLAATFQRPGTESALQTWWHWTSQFVTREGITADLESMAAIGYDTAHIFCAAMTSVPPGKEAVSPRMLSPQWLELYRHACAEAKRLGLHLGVHNCPGWSSSGGPWIKPEDSMKFVVATETRVVGGKRVSLALPRPEARRGFYRDIAVLAFRDVETDERPAVQLDFASETPGEALVDETPGTVVTLPIREVGAQASFTLKYQQPQRPRSLVVQFDERNGYVDLHLEASVDGKDFFPVRDIRYRLFRDPKSPKMSRLSLKEPVRAFRLTFISKAAPGYVGQRNMRLEGVRFLNMETVEGITARNSLDNSIGYRPCPVKEDAPGLARGELLDLTGKMDAEGRLDWEAPAGRWRVMRFGYTTTGVVCAPAYLPGLECDKLNRRGLDAHWPHSMGVFVREQQQLGVLKYATIDSFEVKGQNWTEGFDQEFQRRRGYDLREFLPAMVGYVVGTRRQTAKFLYDLQRTVSDLFAENYFDYFTELCHRDGLLAITEPYGGPFDQLRCARRADMPSGEFWLGGGLMSRMPGSVAHVHGARSVGAEAFTTNAQEGRWQGHPEQLRAYGERNWQRGVSQLIVHSFVHQPFLQVKPGLSLGHHGSQLNRHTTWWPLGYGWADYVRRGQFLLQAGKVRHQALVLAGESQPNHFAEERDVLQAGYGYDFICADDLRECLTVLPDGRIQTPSGAVYDLLHLGRDRYLTVATLRRVRDLVLAGARVSGVCPEDTPSLADPEEEFRRLCEQLWGGLALGAVRELGKGRLCHAGQLLQALRALGVRPSVVDARGLEVVRRQTDAGAEVFLLRNGMTSHWQREVGFVVADGLVPRIWQAVDGRIVPVASWRREGETTRVLLSLAPEESVFVVFERGVADMTPASSLQVVADAEAKATAERRLEIRRAVYRRRGTQDGMDVTAKVRALVTPTGVEVTVGNALVGRDPAPGQYKELLVDYLLDGKEHSVIWPEHTVQRLDFGGSRLPLPFQNVIDESGQARLQFSRQATVEVVGRDGGKRTVAPAAAPTTLDVSADWQVHFPAETGAPATVVLPRLGSLSEHEVEAVRYAAGLVTYRRSIKLPDVAPGTAVMLDLGDVRHVAEVTINGERAGLLWSRPYVLDVTRFCRGASTLEVSIRVALLWPNRLIGDARLRRTVREPGHPSWPDWVLADRPHSGLGITTFSNFRQGWKAEEELQPSGWLGPARLRFEPQVAY